MAELKRNFLGARMNKDVDERLLKPGEYRDANNIEISTSDGSNVGTVQNIKGNIKHEHMSSTNGVYGIPDTTTCVGSVSDKETDKIYYFISGGDRNDSLTLPSLRKNYILEYDTMLKSHKYVFVDIFEVNTTCGELTGGDSYIYIPAPDQTGSSNSNTTGVRIGMTLTTTGGYNENDEVKVTDIKYETLTSLGVNFPVFKITLSKALTDANCSGGTSSIPVNAAVKFISDSVLRFNRDRFITGVNILDGFIYWTDNFSEPKKLNIKRSIMGTGGVKYLNGGNISDGISGTNADNSHVFFSGDTEHFHTRLVIKADNANQSSNHVVVTNLVGKEAVYIKEDHLTVIKKAPTQPLDLEMYRSTMPRVDNNGLETPITGFVSGFSFYTNGELLTTSSSAITFTLQEARDFRADDILNFSSVGSSVSGSYSEWQVKVKVITGSNPSGGYSPVDSFSGQIMNISAEVASSLTEWNIKRDTGDTLFEFKLPRFSYRYKYQDGEYSTFAPWSQVAFLPDVYDYFTKQGYNLGMINQLKSLRLTGYFGSPDIRPRDISEIDILYKETNNPSVYVLRTITPGTKGDQAWPDQSVNSLARGRLTVQSSNIHSLLPSNQLLRPWDNVPLLAQSQEVSANRLIYGNYVQNFDVPVEPQLHVGLQIEKVANADWQNAGPSVRSLRDYSIGLVYSDKYGRETPVLFNNATSLKTLKENSSTRNRLEVSVDPSTPPPSWAEYFSFYVKETSTEYYNLVMDRWYEAGDGNVWISFPSSERNKLDENTFIKLKKKHGSNSASTQDTRYKVLAIEDNAPDAVKKNRVIIGTLFNSGFIGNSEEGYPLQDFTYFTVQSNNFEASIDVSVLTNASESSVRFGGGGVVSNYYEIASVTVANGKHRIELKKPIGPDAAFASTSDTFASAIEDLYVEFFEMKTENKPEFDGRFFAKINSDESLRSEVLFSQDSGQRTVINSRALRYLHNNGYKTSPTQGEPQTLAYAASYSSGRDLHPTEYPHHTDADGENQAKYFWAGNTATGGSLSTSILGLTGSTVASDPVSALNETEQGRVFWYDLGSKEDFFIDSATAYTFTSFIGNADSSPYNNEGDIASGTDNFFNIQNSNDYAWQDRGYTFPDGESPFAHQEWLAPVFNGEPRASNLVGSNINGRGGLPSRGIWHRSDGSGSFMDISWTGMGVGSGFGGELNSLPGRFPHTIATVPGQVFSKASDFISMLAAPGTVFRFQNDPDKVEYTVQGTSVDSGDDYAYDNEEFWLPGTNRSTGAFGIRNWRVGKSNETFYTMARKHYQGWNMRQRWTIAVTPKIGSTANGASGYSPISGTVSRENHGGPANSHPDYRRALHHDATDNDVIEILGQVSGPGGNYVSESAVWETEPKEAAELDIYYQASGLNPVHLTEETNEEFIPIGSTFTTQANQGTTTTHTITNWSDVQTLVFDPAIPSQTTSLAIDTAVEFTIRDSYKVTAVLKTLAASGATNLTIHGGKSTNTLEHKLYTQRHTLNWNNCWMFGNGIESDRIRDDYNEVQMDNGAKASSTINGISKRERRKHGLIWSGVYNSSVGINNTNQFIMAEKITKDINPVYGSIQKLYNRDTRLIMFCEDKILKAVTNKDALYNADGNPQLISSNTVVGDVTSYQGEYGISKDASSFAETPYSIYFTDSARCQVLRLTTEGIVSISDKGMRDYFSKYMSEDVSSVVGSYDNRSKEYNLTVSKKPTGSITAEPTSQTTTSYSDISGGWSSFKSFYPQNGISLNSVYYTFYNGHIWEHYHKDAAYNTFYGSYGVLDHSSVTLIVNDTPGSVKSFGAINYEGSQARVTGFSTASAQMFNNSYAENSGLSAAADVVDGEYYNLTKADGWYVDNVTTDLQTSGSIEFKEKEGKWFGHPSGETTSIVNLEEKEFTVQGLGNASITHSDVNWGRSIEISVENNENPSFNAGTNDGINVWDGGSDIVRLNHICSVATGSFQAQAGQSNPPQLITLEITNDLNDGTLPISDRPWSGHYIAAKNFVIGNGNLAESADGQGTYVWNGEGTNWNVDSRIHQVAFYDNPETNPGDANHKVFVSVSVLEHSFTQDEALYIDIDINEANPPYESQESAFNLDVKFAASALTSANLHDTQVFTSDYVITDNSVGIPPPFVEKTLTGNAVGFDPVEVGKIVFTADLGHRYVPNNTNFNFTIFNTNDGPVDDLYTAEVGGFVSDENGNVTSFTARIFYNFQGDGSASPDPSIYGHALFITRNTEEVYVEPPEVVGAIYTASWVDTDSYYDFATDAFQIAYVENDSFIPINVSGSASAPYRLSLQKKTGTHSISTTATNGYYNFETNLFQTAPYNFSATTSSLGNSTHWVNFPSVSDATRYDLVFSNELTYVGNSVTFGNSVPTAAGEAVIINCGTEAITLKPITYTSSNFGTLPSNVVSTKLSSCSPNDGVDDNSGFKSVGGTSGASSNRLVLNLGSSSIFPGMVVTANGVAHNTTVLSVSEKSVTLSAVATVANDTSILFTENKVSLVPFSFTIVPNGDGDALSVTAGTDLPRKIGGFNEAKNTINGTAAKTITHTLDSTKGIVPGMTVEGEQVKVASGTNLTVASVTNGTVIVLSEAQSFIDGAFLKFSGGNSSSSSISLHSVQANKIGSNIVISGYVNAFKISSTAEAHIYIDDIITVA